MAAARHGRGVLVTRGRADAVAAWAGRGLVPVHLVPFDGWTVLQPAGPSRGNPPYDDALEVLAAGRSPAGCGRRSGCSRSAATPW